jgi:hypothetical protein
MRKRARSRARAQMRGGNGGGRRCLANSAPRTFYLGTNNMRQAGDFQLLDQAGFQRRTHDRRVRDDLDKSQYRVSGNIKVRTRVWLAEALIRAGNCMETSMTRFTFLGVAAFLSTAIATPVLAQAVIQEPGAYAFHYPNGDLGIGSTPSQRREAVVAGGGAAGASAPSVHSSRAGRETATRPWSAPVGHRQPRVADVPPSTSTSQQILDPEDASVDRKIRNVCRGC